MNEERLLRDLAQLAHEEGERDTERFDERWDRLAEGRLSPEEDAELRAEIAGSPELERAYEGFRPVGTETRAAIVRDAAARLASGEKPASPVLSFPSRISRRSWLSSLAVAASLLLAVAIWRIPAAQDPLPAYELSWQGGLETERSGSEDAAEIPRLAPGLGFGIVLSPQTAIEGEAALRIFATKGATPRRWPQGERLATLAKGGAVQISGVFSADLGLEPGEWTLLFVLGRSGALPEAADLWGTEPHPDWQLLEQRVEVVVPEARP